ncbi:hypothetical protein A5707_10265 [Mycobacterium kyorinense]|uniref:UspA domain-containing protein n=1 Tax=Mycobacterium kyorinense TaxID=487514 RepID=A0A1A2YTN6_9MYCO|nr:universal stress protein [Mycobacterium kyorinense]OBI40291.1 hypothetical protein A5707_10265 [Mycobacterium kyorinense]
MRDPYSSCPCVVVGIDGSRSAVQAAIWAVDEAIDRDVPLQLLYAIESVSNDPDDTAAEVASAERAVHNVFTTIESMGKPVKLESEIVHAHPRTALLEASRSAAMVCLGSAGLAHAVAGHIGSTASAVAAGAHCPVAIVPANPAGPGLVLAVVDGSPASNTVVERSVAEALLRASPLRVFSMRQPRSADTSDGVADRSQRVKAELEHRFTHWRRNHPNLDIEPVDEHSSLLNYLEHLQRKATPVQLVVVGPVRPGPLDVLWSPSGRAALEAAHCALMICDRQWWL